MLAADGFKDWAGDFLASQGGAHGRSAAVVVAASEGAGERVARLAFLHTNLLFGGERQRAQAETGLAQVGDCLLGHRASHGARGEVEDALELAFAQGFNGREEHGDSLADAGGGFEEEPPAAGERAISSHSKLPLTGAVARKWEGEHADGLVALLAPMMVGAQPVEVDCGCLLEEGRQVRQGKLVAKLGQFAGIEVQVRQLNVNLLQGVIMGVDIAVELGLSPMQWVRYPVPSALDSLDLI